MFTVSSLTVVLCSPGMARAARVLMVVVVAPLPARGPQVKVTVNGTPWPDIGVPESYLHISQAWPGTWPPGGRGTMMHRHAAPLSPPIGVGRGQRSHAARGFCGPPHSSGVVARGQAGQAPIPHPVSGLSRGVACLSVWLAVRVPLLERGADAVRVPASACVRGEAGGASTISFDLPMSLVAYQYNGATQVPPYNRFGYSFGPVQLVRE